MAGFQLTNHHRDYRELAIAAAYAENGALSKRVTAGAAAGVTRK